MQPASCSALNSGVESSAAAAAQEPGRARVTARLPDAPAEKLPVLMSAGSWVSASQSSGSVSTVGSGTNLLLLGFSTVGHFMQRGNFGEGPHVEICCCDKMEI